jgi:phosphoserine phosphatase
MPAFRHLVSSLPPEELHRRLRATDATVLDLDGCLHWGITQGLAALDLFRRIAFHPEPIGDRRYLTPVALAGLASALKWFNPQRRWRPIRNQRMISLWCRSFRGVPMSYFQAAAQRIPGHSFPGVREAVTRLAQRGPVAIISVGLSVIVDEYVRQFTRQGLPLIAFYRCNRMLTEVRDRREVFAGRYAEPIIATPADKVAAGEHFLDRVGARHPLVIGNDEGETQLARLAQQRGGLAIAVRPPRRLRPLFDAYLTKGDWSTLAALLE